MSNKYGSNAPLSYNKYSVRKLPNCYQTFREGRVQNFV